MSEPLQITIEMQPAYSDELEYLCAAVNLLEKVDPQERRRIIAYLTDRYAEENTP